MAEIFVTNPLATPSSGVQLAYGHSDVIGQPADIYSGASVATGFNITMQTGILVLAPTGTLATGTVTLPLNPPDGAVAEISSTQTQTALTVNANTGDFLLGGTVSALVANTRVAWRYTLSGDVNGRNPRTWVRVQ